MTIPTGLAAGVSLWLVFSYLFVIWLAGGPDTIPWTLPPKLWWAVEIAALPVVVAVAVSLERRGPAARRALGRVGLAGTVALLSALTLDLGFGVYWNLRHATARRESDLSDPAVRATGRRLVERDVSPREYYPTEKNFMVFKPDVAASAMIYGGLYTPKLLDFPRLARSVLELREFSYAIDSNGFSNTEPIADARIFALGDSFTFGHAIATRLTWVEGLRRRLGRPIYNLGVSGSSPRQQLMLLRHLLLPGDAGRRPIRIDRLLWMIYEGNDLEDSYAPLRGFDPHRLAPSDVVRDTVASTLVDLPLKLRDGSVLYRLLSGRLRLALPSGAAARPAPSDLRFPALHSARHGRSLFDPREIELACRPRTYVEAHPHRPLLDDSIAQMAALARERHFTVTVLIAPTFSRLYGRHFDGFPRCSAAPYLIDHVERVAREQGLEVVNLHRLLEPYAQEELLYFRDDIHWNARGHELVAALIAEQSFGRAAPPESTGR